jgi:hypothetical protein
VHLAHLRLRVATESPDLREYLGERGFEVRRTLASDGLLLGQPAAASGVGRAAWMLYESTSTILRRSTSPEPTYAAAAYHLATVDQATRARDRLPMLGRPVVQPDGSVMLFDPYVDSDLAGLDRQLARRGVLVLPTTVASIDPTSGEIVLADFPIDVDLPSGRRPLAGLVFREIPGATLGAVDVLRLARSVVRSSSTSMETTLSMIVQLIGTLDHRFVMSSPDEVAARLRRSSDVA